MRLCKFVVFLGAGFLHAQEQLTLDEAERIALQQHPRLKAAAGQTAAVRAQIQQTRGALQPFVSANITTSAADHGSRIGAGGLNASSIFSRVGTGIAIQQTLYDFGRTAKLTESAIARADAQLEVESQTRAQLRWEVRQAFLRVLSAQKSLAVARAAVDSRSLIRKQIQALVDSQLRSTLDLQFAEVAVGDAQVGAARLEGELTAAEAVLSTTLGYPGPKKFALQDLLDAPELSVNLETLVQEALNTRPDLSSRRKLSKAAKDFADGERRLTMPTVSATGVFGFVPVGDPRLQSRYGGAGVNLNVPIFNGKTLDARKQEANARAESVSAEVRDLELRVEQEVRTAFAEASNALRQISLAEMQVQQAKRLQSMTDLRYRNGLGTIVELNQAEFSRLSAELAEAVARYSFFAAQANLDLVSGRLR